ncbi:MAG: hypothetical protein HYY22_10455 [Thaumarchaeota archaeon]|nr:hypothetical protein [Nitrososphaerota archaeon]
MTESKEQPGRQIEEDLFSNLQNPELQAQKRVLKQIIEDYLHNRITDEEFKTRFFRQIQGIKLWLRANDKTY